MLRLHENLKDSPFGSSFGKANNIPDSIMS